MKKHSVKQAPIGVPKDVHLYHRWDRTQYKYLTPDTEDKLMEWGKYPSTVRITGDYEHKCTIPNGETETVFRLPLIVCVLLAVGYPEELYRSIMKSWKKKCPIECKALPDFFNPIKIEKAYMKQRKTIRDQAGQIESNKYVVDNLSSLLC